MYDIRRDLREYWVELKRSWWVVPLVLAAAWAVTALPMAAYGATAPVYQPAVNVSDIYIIGNGRSVKWRASQTLRVVRGQGRPGTCKTFTLRVRVTELARPSVVLNQITRTLTACYRGRNWTHTGALDIPPQQSAHVYVSVNGGARSRYVANVRPGTR